MADERPKPKFGELAPEGWVWKPPADAHPDALEAASAATGSAPVAPEPAAPATPVAPAAGDLPQKPMNIGDVVATTILLVLGLIATANSIASLLNLPPVIQQVVDQQNLGVSYTATAAATLLGSIGSVVLALIYAAAVYLSVRAIRTRRRSFYIPIACAVLSFMALFFVLLLAFFADGALVNAMFEASRP